MAANEPRSKQCVVVHPQLPRLPLIKGHNNRSANLQELIHVDCIRLVGDEEAESFVLHQRGPWLIEHVRHPAWVRA